MSSKFYTFYDFSYNNGSKPFRSLIDQRLKKKVENLAKLHPEWEESDYFKHFCSIFLHSSKPNLEKRLAHSHLVAYIDFPRCELIWYNFHHFPFYAVKSEDYHALTNEILWQPDKLTKYLKDYDPQNPEQASIRTYILSILKNSIRAKINLRSDWHLLCNVDISSSRKINNFGEKLRQALEKYGLQEPTISQYIFAWKCFLPVYKNNLINNPNRSDREKWSKPSEKEFEQSANDYNVHRFSSNAPLQVASGNDITPETIAEWMNTCIKALRQVETIIEVSLNESIFEKQELEVENELVLFESKNLILKQKIDRIIVFLNTINTKIPQKSRKIVFLLCYLNRLAILNQEQLAKLLELNQGTVSRFISKYIENSLFEEIKKSSNLTNNNEYYINKFLSERFFNPDKSKTKDILLIESIKDLEDWQQYILRLYYGQKKSLSEIRFQVDFKKTIRDNEIEILKIQIQESLTKKIDKYLKQHTKLWLRNYCDNQMQDILIQKLKELNKLNQEIIRKRYCQKMTESAILQFYPEYNIEQIISETKQELHNYLIQWIEENLAPLPDTYYIQTSKVIEEFFTSLIYIKI